MDVEPPPQRKVNEMMVRVFESAELILYGLVGVFLIIIALVAFVAEADNVVGYFLNDSPIVGLNFLFAAIIVLELLMTVIGYMKTKSISLGLLLGAGLTAMVRKTIAFGYQSIDKLDFVLVLAAIVVLVVALYFVGDKTIHT